MKTILFFVFTLILAGCGGAAGPAGAAGAQGNTGPSGATVSSHTACSKVASPWSGVTLAYLETSVRFSNGDVLVTCGVEDGSKSSSYTAYYSSTQAGASLVGCSVISDPEDTDSGYWSFTGSTPTVLFNDSGSAHNNASVSFSAGDCTVVTE